MNGDPKADTVKLQGRYLRPNTIVIDCIHLHFYAGGAIDCEDNVRPKSPGNGPYKCEIKTCAKEFPKWAQYRRHQREHENDKPNRCDKCPASYNVEYNLTLHKATHNTDVLKCPDCLKTFSRLASLKSHLMLHEKDESLICSECGDEFNLQVREIKS